ncbi:hypothetical protein [Streptomyces sp. NPDC005244]|uniref:hypothetical protein n=1 Tax=Streptomyces sp. NPDC005244 TaxID=3364708 RepID=UPI0036C3CC1E
MRQVDGDTVTAVAAVGQPLPPFENGGLSLGEAIRAVTTEIAEEQPEPAGVLLPDIDFAAAVAAVDVPPVPDFMGTVLTELRQAWIDVTGAPPDDANVTLSTPDFVWDMRVMDFVFQPYGLHVSIPIHGNAPDLPGFAEAAGRQAGETMRTLLRARLARCNATRGLFPCECNHPDREPHQHRCGICGLLWRDPVTPTTSMERER